MILKILRDLTVPIGGWIGLELFEYFDPINALIKALGQSVIIILTIVYLYYKIKKEKNGQNN